MRSHLLVQALAVAAAASLAACSVGDSNNAGSAGKTEADLSNDELSAFNYFHSKGLTPTESAAIVGNLIQESDVIPTAEEPGGPGRGIAQWSVGGRWDTDTDDNENTYAANNNSDPWALDTQLDFIWYELTTYSGYGLASIRGATTLTAATVAFETDFEGCGECDQSQRIDYAEQVLAAYGTGEPSGGATCYSATLGKDMPDNSCVQSAYDDAWYQCADGSWVDRWSDPDACSGVYPL